MLNPNPHRSGDEVPPGTFHSSAKPCAGACRGGDAVPPGTFHARSATRVVTHRGGDTVPPGTFHTRAKSLTVTTTKGTKHYRVTPAKSGFDLYSIESRLFGSSSRHLGHASSLENAVFLARVNAGDSIVKSTSLRDA